MKLLRWLKNWWLGKLTKWGLRKHKGRGLRKHKGRFMTAKEAYKANIGDPAAGTPGLVPYPDGIWRAPGGTSQQCYIGSAQEEEDAKLIKGPKVATTCENCYGWGYVGTLACQKCNGKGSKCPEKVKSGDNPKP